MCMLGDTVIKITYKQSIPDRKTNYSLLSQYIDIIFYITVGIEKRIQNTTTVVQFD